LEGWAYLATVIDVASRRVVNRALVGRTCIELLGDILQMALLAGRLDRNVIFPTLGQAVGGLDETS